MQLDFPTLWTPLGIKAYYILSLTYHLDNTLIHLSSTPQNDFYEMLCHHLATLIMISFSWVVGLTNVGVHVMFLMDNADFFVGLI